MKSDFNALISVIRNAVNSTHEKVASDITDIEKIAKKHQIAYMLYTGAVNSGFEKNSAQMRTLFIEANRDLIIHERQTREIQAIRAELEKQGIDYMMLKGSVLKAIYPYPEMRTMGDADILIRPSQYMKVSEIMQNLGYSFVCESDHEYIWRKDKLFVIEFHKKLIPSYNEDYYEYFKGGFEIAKPKSEGASEYTLSAEDTFIYTFTHFTKHYRDGGIGIRHLTDLYVLLKNHPDIDKGYIAKCLETMSLSDFYENILKTLKVWFENKPSTPVTEHITYVIISSGAYGTHKSHVQAQALRASENKDDLLIKKAFPSLSVMRIKYKYLEKAPVLLPFAWCVRILRAIFKKHGKVAQDIKDIKSISQSDIENYRNSLSYVGLKFQKRKNDK